jgi:hypothetical protein
MRRLVISEGNVVDGAVRLLLALILVPAHAPVCKVAAVEACTHSTSSQAPSNGGLPPCCGKCESKPAHKSAPLAPQPDCPKKPTCPTDCLSLLCTHFSAVISDALFSNDLDQPTAERIPVMLQLLSPEGFHTLLDRPPRA